MRSRKKQKAPSINASPVNPLPTWVNSSKSAKRKADNISGDTAEASVNHTATKIEQALETEMRSRLTKKIKACLTKGDKLADLKKECLAMARIERGTVSNAEISAGFQLNTITNYLKNHSKANIDFWRDFVKSHFDTIAKEAQASIESSAERAAASSSTSAQPKPSTSASSQASASSTTSTQATISAPKAIVHQDTIRTCSANFNSIIRADLPLDIRDMLNATLSRTLEHASEYATSLGLQVLKLLLIFNNSTFNIDKNDSITLVNAQGFHINDLVPEQFHVEEDKQVAPPLPKQCADSKAFSKEAKKLLSFQHMGLIHSTYFGARGIAAQSLKANPIHNALITILPRENVQPDLENFVMKTVVQTYSTNFDNMWNNNKVFTKLFNKLLLVLLRHYLAPNREKKRRKYIEEMKEKRTKSEDGVVMRLELMADESSKVEEEVLQAEDDECKPVDDSDKSRRRINVLTSMLRNVIYQNYGNTVTEKIIKSTCKDIAQDEIDAFLKILDRIMPYVPSKQNWFSTAHKIPFVLMANQVLSSLQYSKFAVQLCPLTPVGDLNALKMDSRSLFAILCSTHSKNRRALEVYDFDGRPIPSGDAALEQKDAMFGSFFDLNKVKQICQSYGLRFHQHLVFCPGLKVVRITGAMIKHPVPCNCDGSLKKRKRSSPMPIQDFHSVHEAERRQTVLKADLAATDRERDQLLKDRREFRKLNQIKSYKSQWNKGDKDGNKAGSKTSGESSSKAGSKAGSKTSGETISNNELYWLIEKEKEKRDKINMALGNNKEKLSSLRRELYLVGRYLREAKATKASKKPPAPPSELKTCIKKGDSCFLKAESTTLDESLLDQDCCYGGTDNGVVTFTETSKFDLAQFQRHLKLYNKFQCLETLEDNDPNSLDTNPDAIDADFHGQNVAAVDSKETYAKDREGAKSKHVLLPRTFKITSKHIDRGSGQQKRRLQLEKKKKSTDLGRQIATFEATKSQNPIFGATTPAEVDQLRSVHESHKQQHRDFYYSNSRCRGTQRYEYQRRRFIDRLCADERRHISNNSPVLFVGDRGYGINSRIKGHMRCGGAWKARIHGRYCPVLITNEHNTSQTCVFCFHKTSHPLKLVNKKNKQYLRCVNGTTVCTNPQCLLRAIGETHKARDSLSALAIGLAGLSTATIGQPIPQFDPNISASKTEAFKAAASDFLMRNSAGHAPRV